MFKRTKKPVARIGKAPQEQVKSYLEKFYPDSRIIAQTVDHLVIVRLEDGDAQEAQVFEIDHKFVAQIDGYIGRELVVMHKRDLDSKTFLKTVAAAFAAFQ